MGRHKHRLSNFQCPRCGYTTSVSTHIRDHFNKKKPCPALLSNVVITDDVKNNVLLNRLYIKECNSQIAVECNKVIVFKSATAECDKVNKNQNCVKGKDRPGFIYILQTREHILLKENVYKIGRTENVFQRMCAYPKGSVLLFAEMVNNHCLIETSLIRHLINDESVIHRKDLGNEYFEIDFTNLRTRVYNFLEKADVFFIKKI